MAISFMQNYLKNQICQLVLSFIVDACYYPIPIYIDFWQIKSFEFDWTRFKLNTFVKIKIKIIQLHCIDCF